jgi:hypothetical protein
MLRATAPSAMNPTRDLRRGLTEHAMGDGGLIGGQRSLAELSLYGCPNWKLIYAFWLSRQGLPISFFIPFLLGHA